MIAGHVASTRPRLPRGALALAGGGLALAAMLVLRAAGLHDGLLYPDGYQYLLMARGIAEHLEPVVTLGPGGETLGPNTDAAAKPLFPLLVALLDLLGMSPFAAARAVTLGAAAAVPVLTGLVAVRLGAGRPAALLAVVLTAVSPTASFWFGFAGPDPLAPALALGAALALLSRRPVTGGVLAGLCILARPEYVLVGTAAAIAGLVSRRTRQDALRATVAGLCAAIAILGLLRSPISAPEAAAVAAGAFVSLLAAALFLWAARVGPRGFLGLAAAGAGLLASIDGGAWGSLVRTDWALAVLAAAGLVLSSRRPEARTTTLRVLALSLPLAAAYWVKNPGLERYAAQLTPELALVAAVGLGTVVSARRLLPAGAALAAACTFTAPSRSVGIDAFRELAPSLERAPAGPLVTVAPDAYSTLLPGRTIRAMRPGAEGLVLMDGAARAFDPSLHVDGVVIERYPVLTGFLRPDGAVDRSPALLIRGRVIRR